MVLCVQQVFHFPSPTGSVGHVRCDSQAGGIHLVAFLVKPAQHFGSGLLRDLRHFFRALPVFHFQGHGAKAAHLECDGVAGHLRGGRGRRAGRRVGRGRRIGTGRRIGADRGRGAGTRFFGVLRVGRSRRGGAGGGRSLQPSVLRFPAGGRCQLGGIPTGNRRGGKLLSLGGKGRASQGQGPAQNQGKYGRCNALEFVMVFHKSISVSGSKLTGVFPLL